MHHEFEHRRGARTFSRRSILLGAAAAAAGAAGESMAGRSAFASPPEHQQRFRRLNVTSPNGRVQVTLERSVDGLAWSVKYDGEPVILPSPLGVKLASGDELGAALPDRVTVARRNLRGSWSPPYGRHSQLSSDHQEARVSLLDPNTGIDFAVMVRAYDSGAAIRYALNSAPGGSVTIAGDRTRFRVPEGARLWVSRDEGTYSTVAPDQIPQSNVTANDRGQLADIPVTLELPAPGRGPGGIRASIAEAAREHYPRLLIQSVPDAPDAVAAYLATCSQRGTSPVEQTFSVTTPFETPWRTVTLGGNGVELIDNADLVTTLGRASILSDTSWIRPGKAYRCTQLNTEAGLTSVDLAVGRNLQYVHFDAGWYGAEFTGGSDPRTPIPALDLQRVIAYAGEHDVGISLYVNRVGIDRYGWDEIVELYAQWGVAAIKMGFVFEGNQSQNDRLFEQIRKAGEHKILINAHDNLRPAGWERTLPNYITMEGVRGNEQFPSAKDNVTLPFARNISGPMDYTICYRQSRLQTTSAHQLAMAAVYYSALEWLYWYAPPNQFLDGPPELEWFDKIPTTWQESRALAGDIGRYVVIARRNGDTWYLGAMTSEEGRTVEIPLSFLRQGSWNAHVYADGAPQTPARDTPVVMSQQIVDATTTLQLVLAPSGGQAIRFERA
jgi:alpha-glucosidase